MNPGAYRKSPVCTVFHIKFYPSHDCIPAAMAQIVKEYNEKFSQPHDRYQLASWLHFNVVTLHPTISHSINIWPQGVSKSSGAVSEARWRLFRLK